MKVLVILTGLTTFVILPAAGLIVLLMFMMLPDSQS